jgi:hypothetical protein
MPGHMSHVKSKSWKTGWSPGNPQAAGGKRKSSGGMEGSESTAVLLLAVLLGGLAALPASMYQSLDGLSLSLWAPPGSS